MAEAGIEISIVAPLYNEKGNARHFVERVAAVMRSLNECFEVVLVDDSSSDRTWDQIRCHRDERSHRRPTVAQFRAPRRFATRAPSGSRPGDHLQGFR